MTEAKRETTLIDALVALDDEALARVAVDLNLWRWPRDLPDGLKPRWWDGSGDRPVPTDRMVQERKQGVWAILNPYCEARAGDEAIQREWEEEATHDD